MRAEAKVSALCIYRRKGVKVARPLFWVQITYDSEPPYPLGVTDDPGVAALVKRLLLAEAQERLQNALDAEDKVMEQVFRAAYDKIRHTLDLLIPSELEEPFLADLRKRLTLMLEENNGHNEAPNPPF
jgi:hypothetical protein